MRELEKELLAEAALAGFGKHLLQGFAYLLTMTSALALMAYGGYRAIFG